MLARRFAPLALIALLTACGGEPQAAAAPTAPPPTETPAPTPTPTCAKQTPGYIEAVTPLREEYMDALTVAQATSRISLAPQIAELQRVTRETKAMDVPTCLVQTHGLLLAGQGMYTEAMLDFMSQEADEGVTAAQFKLAATYIDTYESSLGEILAGKEPKPAPTPKPKK